MATVLRNVETGKRIVAIVAAPWVLGSSGSGISNLLTRMYRL
jgi:hypothetical protein